MKKLVNILFILLFAMFGYSQHQILADASLEEDGKTLSIQQQLNFKNESDNVIDYIYLYDWINAFSNKRSALGQSFSQEFVRKFHFADKEERGGTTIKKLSHKSKNLIWKRPNNFTDVIQIKLDRPLQPSESYKIDILYTIKVPDIKFTNFGLDENGISIKYWVLKPALHKEKWYIYSHKRMFDMPQQAVDMKLKFRTPKSYTLTSSLTGGITYQANDQNIFEFPKQITIDTDIYLQKKSNFETTETDFVRLITDIKSDELQPEIKSIISFRVLNFLNSKLGDYPFENLLVSEQDYQIAPVYGLNQLPAFIRPFPDGFQYDIKLFKAVTAKYLKNTILTNTRNDKWMLDAIQINLMMEYVNTYYPNMKLLGKISDLFFVKWFHISDLYFNEQYGFLYKNVTRNNIHQALEVPQDSLIRFNQKIGNPYQAGLGVNFLRKYTHTKEIDNGIKSFYKSQQLKFTSINDFKHHLSKNTSKDISWFFEDYTKLTHHIDFKFKSLHKHKDSLVVKILNKNHTRIPVSLFWLKDKKVIHKQWLEPFDTVAKITIPRRGAERLALNHDAVIPEVNERNNYIGVSKLFNRPIQIRLLEDIEDPKYNQLFMMPEFSYNLYDGVSLGPKLYNGTILPRKLYYKLSPKYGFKSNALVGSASINYTAWQYDKNLYAIGMGAGGSRFSYNFDLFFERYSAFITLMYRNNDNRRDNKRQFLSLRTVNVRRDRNLSNPIDDPDYNILNLRYNYQNKNLDRFFVASVDFELADKFSKVFATTTYRRLYENNRQINLRLFVGAFLHNDTRNSDFFSFAIDRPTDYMFDLNYYGRSEESGLFSQQFVMAEGGFKSKLEPGFANQWLATFNTSTTIWNWIFAYADAGFIGNKFESTKFLYDSGIRLNFVEDYFELYFPIYSNKGWEFNQTNYKENIRFVVTIDISTLFKLFTRKWY